MDRLPLFLFFALIFNGLLAQDSPILNSYIRAGLAQNPLLKEKEYALQQLELSADRADRLYYPSVSFGVNYTLAEGGRTIDIPVGDLVNPAYSALNDLTQTMNFPMLENTSEQFFPDNFYDARVRISQPILNPEIGYNKRIQSTRTKVGELALQQEKRELVRQIKARYFQVLQAREAISIYDKALELLRENRRVNESLVRNDKAIPGVLVRTDSEIAAVRAQRAQAEAQFRNAQAAFNQAIGAALDEPVAIDSALIMPALPGGNIRREEIQQLTLAQAINQEVVGLEASYRVPRAGLQLDLGSQAFDFGWNPYVLLGISVELPLWEAGRNRLKVEEAKVNGLEIAARKENVRQLIDLDVQVAQTNLEAQQTTLELFDEQLAGADRFYRDTERRYREGVSNYIELLDARTQLTTLEIQRSIAYYQVLGRYADLERAVGGYEL